MTSPSTTRAAAGGKIIVLGEHSVVYGHQALAGAIDSMVVCEATPSDSPARLRIPVWNIDVNSNEDVVPARALRAILNAAGVGPRALSVDTTLPPGAGLGSSAALCLAMARCLAPQADAGEHRRIAAAGESEFHHRPSGIDVALSQHGGIARYTMAEGIVPLDVPALSLVVGLSQVPRSTAAQVAAVAERMESDDGTTSKVIARMGEIAERGIGALMLHDLESLGACMNECHECLAAIGVSIDVLDAMVATAREVGALGAKLTGAGGGGAVIALAPGREDIVVAALKAQGYPAFVTSLGARS